MLEKQLEHMNTPERSPFVPDEIEISDACPEELIFDEDHERDTRILMFCNVTINRSSGIYLFDFYSPERSKM